jgi:molecular chaperone GrpE (heat shock protein)
MDNRINLARNMQDMVGKYYSQEWLRKNVLQQTDEDIETQDDQIIAENESGDPRWINPQIQQNEQMEQSLNQPEGPDGDIEQQPLTDDDGAAVTPATDQENNKLQNAKADYDLLSKKKNRSLSDEAKYRSAALILSKNK